MDMAQVVRDNCSIKVLFNCDEEDFPEILSYSKDDPNASRSSDTYGQFFDGSHSEQEIQEPRLKRDEIIEVNSTFGEAFLIFNDGTGHREPLRIKMRFPTTKAKYDELSNKPIPKKSPAAAATTASSVAPASRPDPGREKRLAELRQLMNAIRADQRWQG